MYDPTDPRAGLAPVTLAKARNQPAFPASYARFYESSPDERQPGIESWIVRGQTFVVIYSETKGKQAFERAGQPDEYVLLIPDAGTGATVSAGGETRDIPGHSVTFVPPGDSRIVLREGGRSVRFFTQAATDLVAKASNACLYETPNPAIPELKPWPEPHDGFRIRSYSLDVKPQPGRFGRIFRGSTFMVNYIEPKDGPRDPAVLSPHHHDDFEQCSLVLSGDYIHHLRWPWTTNRAHWRADEHEFCASPSVAIIPPPALHTSQAMGEGINQLVDVFCPPRADFSAKPGWVLNAEEYPLPATADTSSKTL
jgi:hypothetical protein